MYAPEPVSAPLRLRGRLNPGDNVQVVAEIFPDGLDPLLATLAQRFMREGAAEVVEILSAARASMVSVKSDPQLGEMYCLVLTIPQVLHDRLRSRQEAMEDRILQRARRLLPRPLRPRLAQVALSPRLRADKRWRSDAKEWLTGPSKVVAAPLVMQQQPSRDLDPRIEVGDLTEGAREVPTGRERPEPIARRYKWMRLP